MRDLQYYHGREQTYLKHYVLEKYIEELGFKVGSWADTICYVDCFSGPWKANDQDDYRDTSISLSIDVFKKVKSYYEQKGRTINFKCFYIEENKKSYKELIKILENEQEIYTKPINGRFVECIPQVLKEINDKDFAFFFIDPTGWTDFAMNDIKPILCRNNSEVLINFMYDFIQRFIDTGDRLDLINSFNKLFGTPNWKNHLTNISNTYTREQQIVKYYMKSLKNIGNWNYVLNTKITYPLKDKTYFYLIYASRHPMGLKTFKRVESSLFKEHVKTRDAAKRTAYSQKTRQLDIYDLLTESTDSLVINDSYLSICRNLSCANMKQWLKDIIIKEKTIKYKAILENGLQNEFVFEKDINEATMELKKSGIIDIVGMSSRERVPKGDYTIVLK